ncbi:MAG: YeiH family protein [Pseudomonadota bacterium]
MRADGVKRNWGVRGIDTVPGVTACVAGAALSPLLAGASGVPGTAICLAGGLMLGAVGRRSLWAPGSGIVVRYGLRLGVALLGLRIGGLGMSGMGISLLLAISVIAAALITGLAGARLLRLPADIGFVSGASAGVCGVSAALACASLTPPRRGADAELAVVVGWVSLLSSFAMVAWSVLGPHLGWPPERLGAAIGASIHDVAQATGAGYGISHQVGDAAVVAKMARVAMLLPLMAGAAIVFRRRNAGEGVLRRVPVYLPAFALLALLGGMGLVPAAAASASATVSQLCLAAAIVGIGLSTRWQDLTRPDWRIPLLLVAESAAVTLVAVVGAAWLAH